ncbi:MAG TPA: helix-turn-helix domain-containing protein [Thermoanaerobaculia bacterium]|nr:helix-turn-helix domain-containing protein [Thermoanaerobaculia bacterium]
MTPADILTELGLNQLEAEIYTHLLQSEPSTAYRIAQSIGKQTANVYKAVEMLARRGAVMIEEGENRLVRAVPVREFLRHTEREFMARTKTAATMLDALHKPTFDERVYRIESVAETLEKARMMLEHDATRVAVVDAFPKAWRAIAPSVAKAIARGIDVHVQTYEPVTIEGAASHVVAAPGAAVLEYWRSEQLNVVVDGKQNLVAMLSTELDRVYQAFWSQSLYLSTLLHAGLTAEHTLHKLMRMADEKRSPAAIVRALRKHRFFLKNEVPGQKELMRRFRGADKDS